MFKRRNPIDEGGGDPPKEDASPLDNEFTVSSRHPMRPAGADGVEISRVGAFKPTPAAMRPGSETVRRVVDMPNPTRKGESTAMPAESKKLIEGLVKKRILASANVEILAYGELPRSERKTKRVFDTRE